MTNRPEVTGRRGSIAGDPANDLVWAHATSPLSSATRHAPRKRPEPAPSQCCTPGVRTSRLSSIATEADDDITGIITDDEGDDQESERGRPRRGAAAATTVQAADKNKPPKSGAKRKRRAPCSGDGSRPYGRGQEIVRRVSLKMVCGRIFVSETDFCPHQVAP